jgi:hypothetical protein
LVFSLAYARQLSQSQYNNVVKLTTVLYCDHLSCLAERKPIQLTAETDTNLDLGKL